VSGRARAALRPLAAAAMLLVAAAATLSAPTDDAVQSPVETVGPAGRTVVSRLAEADVHGVQAARRLALPAGSAERDSTTSGVWIVVDVTVACRLTPCGFGESRLQVGGRSYAPSPIVPGASFATMNVGPRLRYRTSALFEVPRSALAAGRARLVVQGARTMALEGVPVITMRLPDAVRTSAAVRSTVLVGAAS